MCVAWCVCPLRQYDWIGRVGVLAVFPIFCGNCYMAYYQHGLSKVMGGPHLPGMATVIVYTALRLATSLHGQPRVTPSSDMRLFVIAVYMLVVNAISFVIDAFDTFMWCSGRNRTIIRSKWGKASIQALEQEKAAKAKASAQEGEASAAVSA